MERSSSQHIFEAVVIVTRSTFSPLTHPPTQCLVEKREEKEEEETLSIK
jgi:hypothetical protein